MRAIRWGILGAGVISDDFVTGLKSAPGSEVVACWSRTQARAGELAARHGLRATATLDELLRADVEVVYVATPPQSHKEHALACLAAGKAVLLEKPFAMNAAEAREIASAARSAKRFCMEAMWSRFVPAVRELYLQLKSGRHGEVQSIEASLGFAQSRARDGALLDLGVYPLSFVHGVLGAPRDVSAVGSHDEVSAVLGYASGAQAAVRCSARALLRNDAIVWASGARLEVEQPLFRPESFSTHALAPPAAEAAPAPRGGLRAITQRPELRRWVQRAKGLTAPRVTLPAIGNGYAHEALEVNDCLRGGALESGVLPLDESIAVLETVDRIRGALKS
ncbi:MAG: Gfo/Idh/MocA family oxidoreductase [Myxococcaceae bacterium]|nr:Gfo/Idh/MocA family oxidoreductase [Myxococcaceae bacterium]